MAAKRMTAREAAVRVVQRLSEAGYTAYLAGGCVRDRLMGREPKDYDVATDATPQRVQDLFDRTAAVGQSRQQTGRDPAGRSAGIRRELG